MTTQTGTLATQRDSLLGDLRIWVGTATTTGGVATFNPTSDGTGSGAPLFSNIIVVTHGGETNTGTMTNAPVTSLKAIAADRKSVTVNCFTGTVLGILGATILGAPDGSNVHCVIMGV